MLLQDRLFTYYAVFFVLALLGTFANRFFFAAHLFDMVARSFTLQQVIATLTKRIKAIVFTIVLIGSAVYFYSVLGFMFFRNSYYYEDRYLCENLLQCFVTTLNFGIRSPGGIGDILVNLSWEDGTFWGRFLFDFTFFFVISMLFLNLIFGIIIDTFAELRSAQHERDIEMKDKCFICGITRTRFEKEKASGFKTHIMSDHNMWNYVFFIFHVRKKYIHYSLEFTGPESYVYNCVESQDIEFFPINRAIALEGVADEEDKLKERLDVVEAVCAQFAEFQFGTLQQLHMRLNVVVEELRDWKRTTASLTRKFDRPS